MKGCVKRSLLTAAFVFGCAEPAPPAASADGPPRGGPSVDAGVPSIDDAGEPIGDGAIEPPVSDDASPPPTDGGPPPPCVVAPAPATARLLTRLEYDNSVRDVLGDETAPARALPPENEVLGFDNNAEFHRATPAAVQGYMDLAEGIAARAIAERLARLMPCEDDAAACADALLDTTGRRLFRRDLRPDERAAFAGLFRAVAAEQGTRNAARLTLTALLQSPQFLYRLEEIPPGEQAGAPTPLSPAGLAGRLAAFLWASAPDDALLDAISAGALGTEAQVRAQVERMIADPRARGAVRHFHRQWLGLKALDTLVKDHIEDFPGGNEALRAAYAESIYAFVEEAFWSPGDGMTALLTAPTVYLTPQLAALFGMVVEGEDLVAVEFPADQRAGLITQPALLARLAHPEQTSPIHRGIFVRERILCQPLPPPPANIVIEPPDPDPNATTRERFAQHTEDALCQGCHILIDPIGFGFENYDELGRFRLEENGLPVDASGELVDFEHPEIAGPFEGATELAARLAGSAVARECVATHWFRYAMARGEQPSDACALDAVKAAFVSSGSFVDLLVALTVSDAFRTRPGVVIGEVPPLGEPEVPEPEPEPEPEDQGRAPRGFLDGVSAEGVARGWALDPDSPAAPTLVELYLDGGPGEGLFLLGVRADMARPDVNAAFPEFPGDHGYQTVLPEVARDGRDHTLTAVARDSGGGEDAVLANSPVAFRAGLNANPPAEPDPPPDDHLPEGFVDVARPDGVVAGWALDRDVVDRPLEVHFYLDGPAFAGGTFVGSTRTGLPRPDVNQVIGHPGDHGWQFRLPAEHHDGREHPLWVYAFNAGHPGNANLSRSPITFTPGGGR